MRFWASLAAVLLADRVSKIWIVNNFSPGESQALFNPFLFLTYVQNRGGAFGILQGQSWFFLICAFILIIAMVFCYYRFQVPPSIAALMGILTGGAMGNLVDRWIYGYVVDFFDLRWWPVFNIADVAILCGGVLLVWFIVIRNTGGFLND
ncbi:MAG: signal peptidase II [Syntrophomonadaceae bacterium]